MCKGMLGSRSSSDSYVSSEDVVTVPVCSARGIISEADVASGVLLWWRVAKVICP